MTNGEKTKRLMDNWQFWMGVAYLGLAAVIVALWVNYSRVSSEQARTAKIQAARHADIVANADAQYEQCIKSIPTLTRVDHFLGGVKLAHAVLLENAIRSHQATPPGSPLYQAQATNITRLRVAFKAVQGVTFPIPTRSHCTTLRNELESKP